MKCSIKVNLKYLSPTTRKLLGISSVSLIVNSREELEKRLVDILIMTEREKEALKKKFDLAEQEFLSSDSENSIGKFKQKTLKFTIDDSKSEGIDDAETLQRETRLETLKEAVANGEFNNQVKAKSTEFAKLLNDKVSKYLKDGKFNKGEFPNLSKSESAIKRLEVQIIPYLKNVLYELNILKNANLDNKKEI